VQVYSVSKTDEHLVKVQICELVFRDESTDHPGPFYYIVFIKLGIYLPFTIFEKEILTEFNVVPT